MMLSLGVLLCASMVIVPNSFSADVADPLVGAESKQSKELAKQAADTTKETPQGTDACKDSQEPKPEPSAKMLLADGTVMSRINEGLYKLESGTVLVYERKPMKIQTPHCEIDINARSAVLISAEPEVTDTLDLYDWRYGGVKVSVGTRTKPLSPGDEIAMVAASSPEAAQHLVLKDGLNRRKMKVVSLGNNQFAVASQFSLVDAMLKRPLVSQLKSSQDKDDRATYEQIVKTAAALYMSNSGEPYTVHE
jgi:hypothetical protein